MKTLRIDDATHARAKEYCARHGVHLGHWASMVLGIAMSGEGFLWDVWVQRHESSEYLWCGVVFGGCMPEALETAREAYGWQREHALDCVTITKQGKPPRDPAFREIDKANRTNTATGEQYRIHAHAQRNAAVRASRAQRRRGGSG